jgi:hypothetical protein
MKASIRSALALAAILQFGLGAGGSSAATTDGNVTFKVTITNVSKNDTLIVPGASPVRAPIAPGVFAVSPDGAAIFMPGKLAGSAGLEALAEDGNIEPLQNTLALKFGDKSGMFAPGQPFIVTAKLGDRLSFATMFVQSNDKFYATNGGSLALFDKSGMAVSGDLTASVRLYDAGTEIDQQPGAGADQAPRQKAAGQGAAQDSVVAEAADGFSYPAVAAVIRVNVSPLQ